MPSDGRRRGRGHSSVGMLVVAAVALAVVLVHACAGDVGAGESPVLVFKRRSSVPRGSLPTRMRLAKRALRQGGVVMRTEERQRRETIDSWPRQTTWAAPRWADPGASMRSWQLTLLLDGPCFCGLRAVSRLECIGAERREHRDDLSLLAGCRTGRARRCGPAKVLPSLILPL